MKIETNDCKNLKYLKNVEPGTCFQFEGQHEYWIRCEALYSYANYPEKEVPIMRVRDGFFRFFNETSCVTTYESTLKIEN